MLMINLNSSNKYTSFYIKSTLKVQIKSDLISQEVDCRMRY